MNLLTKHSFLSFLLCLLTFSLYAQPKRTKQVQQIWTGYFNQTRFTDKWGLWTDVHLRTQEDFVNKLSQGVARVGLTYYLNDATKLTAGYAYVHHFPADNHKEVAQPEHRPWQQIQWHNKYTKVRTMQWLRLEERFRRKIQDASNLVEGYNFNYKIRYNFFLQTPLSKKHYQPRTLSFVVNNEVHLNFGKQIVYNYFDQNRFFLGFNYHLNAHDNLQFGYMNLFQQLSAGNQYRSVHTARIFYFHNLDLRPH